MMLKSITCLAILAVSVLARRGRRDSPSPASEDDLHEELMEQVHSQCPCKDPCSFFENLLGYNTNYQSMPFNPLLPNLPTIGRNVGLSDKQVKIAGPDSIEMKCHKVKCDCCKTLAVTFRYVSRAVRPPKSDDFSDKKDCVEKCPGGHCCQQGAKKEEKQCSVIYQSLVDHPLYYYDDEKDWFCAMPVYDTLVAENGIELYRCEHVVDSKSAFRLYAPTKGGFLQGIGKKIVSDNTLYAEIDRVHVFCDDKACGKKIDF